MKKWWIVVLVVLPLITKAQIITTFAGKDGSGVIGDGGPATDAKLNDPGDGMFDRYGNYYFADAGEKRIRKIDTNGIITTVAGGGSSSGDGIPATNSKLNIPNAVKLDSLGNLYIADGGNNNVRKVDIVTGVISTFAGNGTGGVGADGIPATASMLWDPQDICFDKFGNLYISEAFTYRVRKVNTLGIISTFAGTGVMGFSGDNGPATTAQFDLPEGMVADSIGNIYIADPGSFSNRVRKIDTAGIITTVVGNGTGTYIGDGIPATNAQIAPYFLAIDSFYNLYVSDRYNQRIYKIDTEGIIHDIAGNGIAGGNGDGGSATAAELYAPTGVALDACGNLYICDVGTLSIPDSFRNIRKVTFNPTCDPYSHRTITDSSSLSINAITTNNITIYPNPATATLSITASNKITQITISNLIGQVVYSQSYAIEKAEVNISGLPEGMYIVKVTDGEGRVMVTKIVKE